MFSRILAVTIVAGFLAGLSGAVIQHFKTTPLILLAESYQQQHNSEQTDAKASHSHDHGDDDVWMPENGFERIFYTFMTTSLIAIGMTMLLIGAMLLSNVEITIKNAMIWSVFGFISTGLAPAFGISPELPSFAASDVSMRQIWWIATVILTSTGSWFAFQLTRKWSVMLGCALIVLPHIIGAPVSHEFTHVVPAEIAGQFVANSLVTYAVIWMLIGYSLGYFWQMWSSSDNAQKA